MCGFLHTPIVITLPEVYPNEVQALHALAENGAEIIHLRKPGISESRMCGYLEQVDPAIRHRLTIHYAPQLANGFGLGGIHAKPEQTRKITGSFRRSASSHAWTEVRSLAGHADYVFLSPVFDSVSKRGYKAAFTGGQLETQLADRNRPAVVALGGIAASNMALVRGWGFEGVAAIGSIWAVRNGAIDIEQTVAHYTALTTAWNRTK